MIRIALTVLALTAFGGTALAEESKPACAACPVTETAKVPAKAVEALTKLTGAAPAAITSCTKDGKALYCATVKGADGKEVVHMVDAEGVAVECKDCVGDKPKAM